MNRTRLTQCPDYRVRLFLSVDLAGSTAYKNVTEAESANPLAWVEAFQDFYRRFPKTFEESYRSLSKDKKRQLDEEEINKGCPKFWKRVGDEILFCCRLYSLCHLGLCIDAFIKTLQDYAVKVENKNLSVKGNAWIASFPVPNVIVRLEHDAEPDYLPGEDVERQADEKPHIFDFLGKEIDAGFRIAKNSSPDELTVSPALAFLLCLTVSLKNVTGYGRSIRLKEMQAFKGVAENEPYPVLVLDTCPYFGKSQFKKLERKLLSIPEQADNDNLREYLKAYLREHKIPVPAVRSLYITKFANPPFYEDFKLKYNDRYAVNEAEDSGLRDSVLEGMKIDNADSAAAKREYKELLAGIYTEQDKKNR